MFPGNPTARICAAQGQRYLSAVLMRDGEREGRPCAALRRARKPQRLQLGDAAATSMATAALATGRPRQACSPLCVRGANWGPVPLELQADSNSAEASAPLRVGEGGGGGAMICTHSEAAAWPGRPCLEEVTPGVRCEIRHALPSTSVPVRDASSMRSGVGFSRALQDARRNLDAKLISRGQPRRSSTSVTISISAAAVLGRLPAWLALCVRASGQNPPPPARLSACPPARARSVASAVAGTVRVHMRCSLRVPMLQT